MAHEAKRGLRVHGLKVGRAPDELALAASAALEEHGQDAADAPGIERGLLLLEKGLQASRAATEGRSVLDGGTLKAGELPVPGGSDRANYQAAFELLKSHSQASGQKLSEVAQAVTSTHRLLAAKRADPD